MCFKALFGFKALTKKKSKTSELSLLENLPSELKEKIFLNLPPNDLLNLMRTSRSFYSFIESNKKLMRKLPVRVSQLVRSKVLSQRRYSHIFVDGELSRQIAQTVKDTFVNIGWSVEVITFNQRFDLFHRHDRERIMKERDGAEDLVLYCSNFKTINMIRSDNLKQLKWPKSDLKTLNVHYYCTAFLPFFDVEEVNMLEGVMLNRYINFPNMSNLQQIHIFKVCLKDSQPIDLFSFPAVHSLKEITFQNCRISVAKSSFIRHRPPFDSSIFMITSLKRLRLINCQFDEAVRGTLLLFSRLDELHIENCENFFWKPDNSLKSMQYVDHLKLVNLTYKRSERHKIEDLKIKNVGKVTMDNVIFSNRMRAQKEDDQKRSQA